MKEPLFLESGVGDRSQKRIDLLEIADRVEMDRAGLEAACRALAEPGEVPAVGFLLEFSEAVLFHDELTRGFVVARDEQVEGQPCVGKHGTVEGAEFLPALLGEFEIARELLLHLRQHVAHDDVADLLELDAGADQFLAAQPLPLRHRPRGGPRQIELGGRMPPVDLVVEGCKLGDAFFVGVLVELDNALKHDVDCLADADDLARGIGQRLLRTVEIVFIERTDPLDLCHGLTGRRRCGEHDLQGRAVDETRKRRTSENDQAVEQDMGVDDLACRIATKTGEGQGDEHDDEERDDRARAAHEQIAERHDAGKRRGGARQHRGDDRSAEIGPQYHDDAELDRHEAACGERGDQQDRRDARMKEPGHDGGDQEGGDGIAREIVDDQRQDAAVAQRLRGLADQPERQEQEADTDEDAAELAPFAPFGDEKDRGAEKDCKRHEFRQVEAQELDHEGGPDIGAERAQHACRAGDDAGSDKGADEEPDGRRALKCHGKHQPRRDGRQRALQQRGEPAAQAVAIGALDARAHHAGRPEKQRHGAGKVQQNQRSVHFAIPRLPM